MRNLTPVATILWDFPRLLRFTDRICMLRMDLYLSIWFVWKMIGMDLDTIRALSSKNLVLEMGITCIMDNSFIIYNLD